MIVAYSKKNTHMQTVDTASKARNCAFNLLTNESLEPSFSWQSHKAIYDKSTCSVYKSMDIQPSKSKPL